MTQRAGTNRPEQRLVAFGALLAGAVFLVDLRTPLGAAPGMLYVLVILLGLWGRSFIYPVAAAAVSTMLILVGLAAGWDASPDTAVYFNGPAMTVILWVTAAVVVRFKRLELAASQQVKQLAAIKHALDQAAIVATTDVSGRITYANDKFCEISKYSRDELLGQDHRIVNSALHPKAFMRELWTTIANGRIWHGEIRNRAKDGTCYWVDTTIVPFLNERGKPYQYTAIRSDITKRKLAERQLQEQAALARVGQMAAIVAHEVKNPLAGIKGVMQVLMSRRSPGDSELGVMKDIVSRIDALDDLIQDLMVFARPRSLRLSPVEISALVDEAIEVMRKDPAAQNVDIVLDSPTIAAMGDPEMLKAAFLNLLLNAAQAMDGRGTIRVNVRQDGGQCRIDVADTGPGIPAELEEKIFEPFFTTKHRGGGLGLAIARRSLELHGGSIVVGPRPAGGGTVMKLQFPLNPPALPNPHPLPESAFVA
jgi:PAS domain S-box-containing protein